MNALATHWRAAWPRALAVWSKYTRIRDARLCASTIAAAREGLSGSFAMIRLSDQSVVIDLEAVARWGLEDYAVEILAHEIGHHVLAPASATDHFRMLARIRRALPTLEAASAMVANLYTDLLINDRLQRQAGLRMADVYRRLAQGRGSGAGTELWQLYMGIYEHLWRLDKGSLGGPGANTAIDTDAWLGAKLVRVYAGEPMAGAARFAALLLPYLAREIERPEAFAWLSDTRDAAADCDAGGIDVLEPDECGDILHPIDDPRVVGADAEAAGPASQATGQARDPFEYGEILKAGGVAMSAHDVAVRYYRARALPYLVPFPARPAPEAPEPQLEGVEPWEVGAPLDDIDWLQSVLASPVPIPGVTMMRRTYGREPDRACEAVPVDLDLYVDSSGSMPNPQVQASMLALAGAIIALSALRADSRVQVTLWSGKRQVLATDGFVEDAGAILHVLTGFFGGGTCFPIHRLRETYAGATPRARPTHILMISDEGIDTMFDDDERGRSGWAVAADALAAGNAGGTMALNLPANWEQSNVPACATIRSARSVQGWDIHAVTHFDELLVFARAFSARHYRGAGAG